MSYSIKPAGNPFRVPPGGTPLGDQQRDAFYAALNDLLGEAFIWVPQRAETTTSTSRDLNKRTVTYDATVAARIASLGSGVSVDFDGTDDEADTPDVAALSFGDGAEDEPFTVVVLCKPDVNNAVMSLLAKEGSATAEEWGLELDASGYLVLRCTDESASATLLGTGQAAVGTGWVLIGASYTGSTVNTGIAGYVNGLVVTLTAGGAGTYVAMEDTAALVHLGARYTTKAQFFNGRIALAAVANRALSDRDHWVLRSLVNSFYDLAL